MYRRPLLPQEKIGIFSWGRRGRLYTGYDKAHLLKYIPIKHLPAMEATSKFMNTDIFSFSSINEIFFSLLFVDLNLRIMRLNLFVKRTLPSCWCMIEQLDNWLMLQFNRLISRGSHITQFYHLLKSATFRQLATLQDRSLWIKPERINNFLRLFRIVLLKWQITKKRELEDLFSLAS